MKFEKMSSEAKTGVEKKKKHGIMMLNSTS
jgi:hypothetical protein